MPFKPAATAGTDGDGFLIPKFLRYDDCIAAIRDGSRQGTADAYNDLLRYPEQVARVYSISVRQVQRHVKAHGVRLLRLGESSVKFVKRTEFEKLIKRERA